MLVSGLSLVTARPLPQAAQQTGNAAVREAKPRSSKRGGAREARPAKTSAPATGNTNNSTPESESQSAGTSDAASFYALGMNHYESKRFKEAVEAFKQAIRLGSTEPKTYFSLGQSYYSLNLYKEAREAYKRAVRVKPDWAEAHYQLGWMYHILGDEDASQSQYKILQTLDPEMAASFQKLLGNEQASAVTSGNNTNSATGNSATGSAANGSNTNAGGATGERETAQAPATGTGNPSDNQSQSQPAANNTPASSTTVTPPATDVRETDVSTAGNLTASNNGSATSANPNATDNGSGNGSAATTGSEKTGATSNSSPANSSATGSSNSNSGGNTGSNSSSTGSEQPPTSLYRVGVGDVLDIRLLNSPTARSTLFTVMSGGLIEYPLAGGAFAVGGLTTDEVAARLTAELKRRGIGNEDSTVVVGVRDYGSHSVIVSGLVNYPGTKIMRREAVPLYVIIAEAQLRPDAGRAIIMRGGEPIIVNDLTDAAALNVLVRPGDVITISARQLQYYFIGGRINSPGQKIFQPGITLTQAILAAGGLSRSQETVEISREEADGRLTTTKYELKAIKSGKIPDPRLQPGDRVEVGH